MKTLPVVFLLAALSAHALAQTQNTGPVRPTGRVVWYMADGASLAAAQAYEARLFVDGSSTPTVLPGVTCVANTVTDPTSAVWSFGSGQAPSLQLLRNGTPVANVFGAKLSLLSGVLYLQGDDSGYYRWSGTAFAPVTASDPAPAVIDAAAVGRWNCSAHPPQTLIRVLNVFGPHKMVLRLYEITAKVESGDSNSLDLIAPVTVMAPIRVQIEVK